MARCSAKIHENPSVGSEVIKGDRYTHTGWLKFKGDTAMRMWPL